MITVTLKGGLGNQMFQYAAGRALALKQGTSLQLDLSILLDRSPFLNHVFRDYDLDIFDIQPSRTYRKIVPAILTRGRPGRVINRYLRRFIFHDAYFHEPHFHHYKGFYNLPVDTYLDGFWQSPKYFHGFEPVIRQDFTFRYGLLKDSRTICDRIGSETSICVNVRRTDFANNPSTKANLGVCDMGYFAPALDLMRSRHNQPHFFIFSDEPAWCEQNFTGKDMTVVGHEHKGTKFSNYLQLMTRCKHFIIPNSTFAWWAVWLNAHDDKTVIAPKRWFAGHAWDTSDLVPEGWIRL